MSFAIPTLQDIAQPALAARLQHLLDNKTKPQGSLGRIEALAQRIGLILGSEAPELKEPQLVVFAGDHSVKTTRRCACCCANWRACPASASRAWTAVCAMTLRRAKGWSSTRSRPARRTRSKARP